MGLFSKKPSGPNSNAPAITVHGHHKYYLCRCGEIYNTMSKDFVYMYNLTDPDHRKTLIFIEEYSDAYRAYEILS